MWAILCRKYLNQSNFTTGNILNTRKYHVKFVTSDTDEDIVLTEQQKAENLEIEQLIIERLAAMHAEFMRSYH